MDTGLAGRVALVIGGSRGLGHAVAEALTQEGARVAITSRSEGAAQEAAAGAAEAAYRYDMADPADAPRLLGDVRADLGPIEVLVCNTGGPPPRDDPLAYTALEWQASFQNLVLGPVALIAAAVPDMQRLGRGRIVNIGSTSVREPISHLMLSGAQRSATVSVFKTLARALASDGITINTLLPGRIATERLLEVFGSDAAALTAAASEIPAGRLGDPQELAAAAVFLCSDGASYVTGTTIAVDGGLTRGV